MSGTSTKSRRQPRNRDAGTLQPLGHRDERDRKRVQGSSDLHMRLLVAWPRPSAKGHTEVACSIDICCRSTAPGGGSGHAKERRKRQLAHERRSPRGDKRAGGQGSRGVSKYVLRAAPNMTILSSMRDAPVSAACVTESEGRRRNSPLFPCTHTSRTIRCDQLREPWSSSVPTMGYYSVGETPASMSPLSSPYVGGHGPTRKEPHVVQRRSSHASSDPSGPRWLSKPVASTRRRAA